MPPKSQNSDPKIGHVHVSAKNIEIIVLKKNLCANAQIAFDLQCISGVIGKCLNLPSILY